MTHPPGTCSPSACPACWYEAGWRPAKSDHIALEGWVRDMPEETAQVLRDMGYQVTRPSDIPMARAPVWSSQPPEGS